MSIKNGRYKICLTCNNSFYLSLSLLKTKAGKYCSHICYWKSLKNIVSPNLKSRKIPNGHKHRLWKGEKVSYSGLHYWVSRWLGKPTKCEHCEKDGLKGKKIHWANKSGEYKRELEDWLRLCGSCHILYDNERRRLYA